MSTDISGSARRNFGTLTQPTFMLKAWLMYVDWYDGDLHHPRNEEARRLVFPTEHGHKTLNLENTQPA